MTDQLDITQPPGAHVDCPVCPAKRGDRCNGRRPHAERVEKEITHKMEAALKPIIDRAMGLIE